MLQTSVAGYCSPSSASFSSSFCSSSFTIAVHRARLALNEVGQDREGENRSLNSINGVQHGVCACVCVCVCVCVCLCVCVCAHSLGSIQPLLDSWEHLN